MEFIKNLSLSLLLLCLSIASAISQNMSVMKYDGSITSYETANVRTITFDNGAAEINSKSGNQDIFNISDLRKIYFSGFSATEDIIENSMSVYPNPGYDFIRFNSDSKVTKYAIYNITGMKVLENDNYSEEGSIDISSLNPGIYFLRANEFVTKFVKL